MRVTRYQAYYQEYLHTASDSRLTEWVNDEIIAYLPPTLKHQEISEFLSNIISSFVTTFQLGMMLHAPFESPKVAKLSPGTRGTGRRWSSAQPLLLSQ